jgi:hypothetical protein
MFSVAGLLAAAGLYKAKIKIFRIGAGWVLPYLWIVLFLSKSLAAFLYTVVAVPLVLFVSPKMQFRVAALLAIVLLLYPSARAAGIVPVREINDWAEAQFGEERAASMMTRFVSEEFLLERAAERPFFGWGTYGRAEVYDARPGGKPAIRDGDWIITLGDFGRVGFVGKYLLLVLPIFLAGRRLRRIPQDSDRRLLAALAVIVGFSVFDLLPNGNYNYLVLVFAGALMSCADGIARNDERRRRLKRELKSRASQPELLRERVPPVA